MDFEPIIEIFDPVTIVQEMATGGSVLVTVPPEIVERVTDGDSDPKFATFVIESGWSRSKRLWDAPVFDSVHQQIAEQADDPIVGYLGHIKPEDDPYSFPEIQFQWLRSAIRKSGDKVHLFTKAYVLPDTKARYYLKRGLAKTVSWRGDAVQVPFQKGVRVSEFKMESIDLARPRKAGMSARLVGALTSEMHEEDTVKPEEIAALQANELRAHNPTLVAAIEADARKPLETKASEMEEEAKTLKTDANKLPEIRKVLGIADDADPIDVVKKMMDEVKAAGRTVRDGLIDSVLGRKFKDEHTRALVKRVIASEMDSVQIVGDSAHKDDDEKKISEMVNKIVDEDEHMKEMVSEMEGTTASVASTAADRNGKQELKPGVVTPNLRVRAVN